MWNTECLSAEACLHPSKDAFLKSSCRDEREPCFVTGVLDAMDFRLDVPRGAEHVLGLLTNGSSFEKRLKVTLVLLAIFGDKDVLLHGLHLELAPELVLASALALVAHDQGVTPRRMTTWQLVQRGWLRALVALPLRPSFSDVYLAGCVPGRAF